MVLALIPLTTVNWKTYLTSLAIIALVFVYIKRKLTFWSRQQIPSDLFLIDSWFVGSINEMDQVNIKKMGKVFG